MVILGVEMLLLLRRVSNVFSTLVSILFVFVAFSYVGV